MHVVKTFAINPGYASGHKQLPYAHKDMRRSGDSAVAKWEVGKTSIKTNGRQPKQS